MYGLNTADMTSKTNNQSVNPKQYKVLLNNLKYIKWCILKSLLTIK